MPFVGGGIIVDANGRTEARAAVGAARNHHIGAVAVAGRSHAAQHVDVVVGCAARAVNCQEYLAYEASWVDRPTNHAASHVHRRNLVKRRRLVSNLRIRRANTPEATSAISAANEEIAVSSNVECSPPGRVRETQRRLPGDPAIGGAVEQPASAGRGRAPSLVLKAVPRSVRLIYGKPFLVACSCVSVRLQFQPGLAAVCGAVDVIAKCLQQAEVEIGL